MLLYEEDLAFVQAEAFGGFAEQVAPPLIERLCALDIPVRRVVDVGCGAGVTTRALVRAGFEVVAIEPSPALLERARSAAPEATFHLGSAYEVGLPRRAAFFATRRAECASCLPGLANALPKSGR